MRWSILPTKIFAHRGASQFAPENTMPAFQLAYELGAEGIETDVHLTKDLVPVLIHDEQLKRTTNGYGYVKDYTFNELQNFDAGSRSEERRVGKEWRGSGPGSEWGQERSVQRERESDTGR